MCLTNPEVQTCAVWERGHMAQVSEELISERQLEPSKRGGSPASSAIPGEGRDDTDLKFVRGVLYAFPIGALQWLLIWVLIRLAL
jgi:hypothetical protein